MRIVGQKVGETNDLQTSQKSKRGRIQTFMWSQTKTVSGNGGNFKTRIAQTKAEKGTAKTKYRRPIVDCLGIRRESIALIFILGNLGEFAESTVCRTVY